MRRLIFIVGPTAIGKTRLAVKLARKIRGEIISCDSMQVYKGMSILSQAPGPTERKAVRHYLVGVLDPSEEYSVALFREKASKIIESIIRRKKIPIIAGGTGLYVKALIDGLFPSPEANVKFRKKMSMFVKKYGSPRLHARLSKIDPEAAKRIHPNDARRIIRALEIYDSTGRTMTELKSETKGLKDVYKISVFGLTMPREKIYANIDSRTGHMFETGVVEEVRRLRKKRLSKTAKAALGFKEIDGYLRGDYGIDTAADLLRKNTRNLAKRQLTWFRADKNIKWFDLSKVKEDVVLENIVKETV